MKSRGRSNMSWQLKIAKKRKKTGEISGKQVLRCMPTAISIHFETSKAWKLYGKRPVASLLRRLNHLRAYMQVDEAELKGEVGGGIEQ